MWIYVNWGCLGLVYFRLEDNKELCLNYDEFKGQLLEATTPKGTRIQALIKLLALEKQNSSLDN
ncbi:hypothetical protein DSO57_1005197 [Entomophthora muscae]|uniref:Uncharacterized protein n=1 Tax=Entomophthora muscae TaxID=34485 RepID=A0ACC2T7V0_9FUNG|nr:hypothetical protein DSO57_1005197 [Entomophthora muscae]